MKIEDVDFHVDRLEETTELGNICRPTAPMPDAYLFIIKMNTMHSGRYRKSWGGEGDAELGHEDGVESGWRGCLAGMVSLS